MKTAKKRVTAVLSGITMSLCVLLVMGANPSNVSPADQFKQINQLCSDGNYKEALEQLKPLMLDKRFSSTDLMEAIDKLRYCMERLNRLNEFDGFVKKLVAARGDDFYALWAAGRAYQSVNHSGIILSGEFIRTDRWQGGGRWVNAFEHDRVESLRYYVKAMVLLDSGKAGNIKKNDDLNFYDNFSHMIIANRDEPTCSWRLQYKTSLDELPDYDDAYYSEVASGAPVDGDGKPVFYGCPASWDAAANDGERWRFTLSKTSRITQQYSLADFSWNNFGVQTLRRMAGGSETGGGIFDKTIGLFSLFTLGDNETIAQLANGVQRFKLPEDYNYIKYYKEIKSWSRLGEIYENRMQYDKAVESWENYLDDDKKRQLDGKQFEYTNEALKYSPWYHVCQILGNWGRFEPVMSQPYGGNGATVEFVFRNGNEVNFSARKVDAEKLLADIRAYIMSKPQKVDYDKLRLYMPEIGRRLLTNYREKYIGSEVANWMQKLSPAKNHFETATTIQTPLKEPGCYLLRATMKDGNSSLIVLWVSDMVIVTKPVESKNWCFVADSRTGEPVEGVTVECFSSFFNTVYDPKNKKKPEIRWQISSAFTNTNDDGVCELDLPRNYDRNSQVIAKKGNRFAFMESSYAWGMRAYKTSRPTRDNLFLITDRPVYRPGDWVKLKVWLNRADYVNKGVSPAAGKNASVRISDRQGRDVKNELVTLDQYGGAAVEWQVPAEAGLGVYNVRLCVHDGTIFYGGNFRVEEYKKPEFEVTVEAPKKPVKLGEIFTARVKAKYYFGQPVTNGTVTYTVLRRQHTARWYPPMMWDWLYGDGYGWLGEDWLWYPGWVKWGCCRPVYAWYGWWQPEPRPEQVARGVMKTDANGEVEVKIDTMLARELYAGQSHEYEIKADVVDASRRTISGSGKVIAAEEPFKVYAWLGRGFYRVGDTVNASFAARMQGGGPVQGKGRASLYSIRYEGEDRTPRETLVRSWDANTDRDGRAELKINASKPGQYRLACVVDDGAGHRVEGGTVFSVWGDGDSGSDFRFNDLEVLADCSEYKPGDTARLRINTDKRQSWVWLFVRPENGAYPRPKLLRLNGMSVEEAVDIEQADMPNIFVEAMTIAGGSVHNKVCRLAIPPASRVLKLDVMPDKQKYKAGEKAKVKLKLCDENGKPFVGSLVLTLYDKALEYISGGGNVQDIRKFFWGWLRSHTVTQLTSLDGKFGDNIFAPGQSDMMNIGIFGRMTTRWAGSTGEKMKGITRARGMSMYAGMDMECAGEPREMMKCSALPMAAKMEMADGMTSEAANEAGGAAPEVTVREKFADAAFWKADITTDANGMAEVELNMPENLTTWVTKAWAMGLGCRVGQASTDVITTKDLIVRLETPRFLVDKDKVTISAIVHNYLPTAQKVKVTMEWDATVLKSAAAQREVEVASGGEARLDYEFTAISEGQASVTVKAIGQQDSDAMAVKFPVHVHGMDKTESFCGVVSPDGSQGVIKLNVPAARRPESAKLEIRFSPTLALAMLDTLPFLIEYPYGCTEQTLNRFVPAVITRKTLQDMGINLQQIKNTLTNLNSQELSDTARREHQWKRPGVNPVFDEAEMDRIVHAGMTKLVNMQCGDGGWGWFTTDRSYPHTTAVVMHGLTMAKKSDMAVDGNAFSRGLNWLAQYQKKRYAEMIKHKYEGVDSLDAFVFMVLAENGQKSADMKKMLEVLYDRRTKYLSVQGLAMLGLACHYYGDVEKRDMLLRNVEQYLRQDDENQTVWLEIPDTWCWWFWYGNDMETMAWYLKLLCAVKPDSPVAPRLVKYMVNNRRNATYWRSTRDTAYCVEALADYIKASGEQAPDQTIEVQIDGKTVKTVKVTKESLFTFDNAVSLEGEKVTGGRHEITLKRTGKGRLWYNAYLSYFTLEDPIKSAGLEVKIRRKIYLLAHQDATIKTAGKHGQVLDKRVEKFTRVEIPSPFVDIAPMWLNSGDLIEVELEIESKNDYEYFIVEDFKAAGCEPVEVRSGYSNNGLGAYMELRDNRVCLFVQMLPRGKHNLSYRLRAEIPGVFSALPATISGMYAPELKANSNEMKIRIKDEN